MLNKTAKPLRIPQSSGLYLGACRTYGDRGENSAGRGLILSVLQVNSHSIDQKTGEIWTAQADFQPIHHESDRLLGLPDEDDQNLCVIHEVIIGIKVSPDLNLELMPPWF